MAIPAAYLGAILGFAVGVHLQGTIFGQTSKAGYHAPDGKLMSKTDATKDKALFILTTSVVGYLSGPEFKEFLISHPLTTVLLAIGIVYYSLHEEIEAWA